MKKLLTLFALLVFASTAVPQTVLPSEEPVKVYICTGKYSTTYHAYKSCRGLNNCKGVVKEVAIDKAIQMGRRACKVCWE